ncbi:MAG: outer membrane beta-barrel protein [Candidatus Limisoma sp.]
MKRIAIISTLMLAAMAANAGVVDGKVVDEKGNPVEYATVVALRDAKQCAGTVTDSVGGYTMNVADGAYTFIFSSVGYKSAEKSETVKGKTRVDATMETNSAVLKEVNVTASAIRREADRFVMNVENMPGAIGKDGEELLRDAPGVWINDNSISINGKSGTIVYVNDRELKMDNDQLMTFLRNLKAEEVTKVEIIPQTGAEYSANSSAGVIKITMKKARTDGIMGSAGIRGNFSKNETGFAPNASLNVKKGNWTYTLRGTVNYNPKEDNDMTQSTDYADGSRYNNSTKMTNDNMVYGNVNAGVFYDPNKNNSFGLELYYQGWKNPGKTITRATFADKTINGDYSAHMLSHYIDATFNYIHRLDTLGSTMKVIANYNNSHNTQENDNIMRTFVNPDAEPHVEKENGEQLTTYDVANLSFDYDKHFSPKWGFAAGAKYTFNKMHNTSDYGELYACNYDKNHNYDYNENILGIYAKATYDIKHLGVVAGLRGEYFTDHSRNKMIYQDCKDVENLAATVDQDYFDLFPNASIIYKFDAMSKNSLSASYARYINRPSFWALNPIRTKISDMFYQCGNPDLKPTYSNNLSLNFTTQYKYNLSLWWQVDTDPMAQGTMPDENDPRNVLFTNINLDKNVTLGANVNLPIQITKWWNFNANVTYMHRQIQLNANGDKTYANSLYISLNTGFQLPKDWYISASYFGSNRGKDATMSVNPFSNLNAGIKKSFANRKWTAAINANNILCHTMRFTTYAVGNGFNNTNSYASTQRIKQPVSFSVSLTYNFNVGKRFQAKSIEKNADESRTQKSK